MFNSAKHGAKHVKNGVIITYKDAIYWSKLSKIEQKSITEIRDYDRISCDLLKMVPFSAFVTIPLMELALPPYVALFPNAVP